MNKPSVLAGHVGSEESDPLEKLEVVDKNHSLCGSDLTITTLDRLPPELSSLAGKMEEGFPPFLNVLGKKSNWIEVAAPRNTLVCVAKSPEGNHEIIGKGRFSPFHLDAGGLPANGWDAVIDSARKIYEETGRPPDADSANAVSALAISIPEGSRGLKLSYFMLNAMKKAVNRMGFSELYAPVRPSKKQNYPEMAMEDYINLLDKDGFPQDPWLRTHVKAGGKIVGIAPHSMSMSGSVNEWAALTGIDPDQLNGKVIVPDALVPVHFSEGVGVYREPNVWVIHETKPSRSRNSVRLQA